VKQQEKNVAFTGLVPLFGAKQSPAVAAAGLIRKSILGKASGLFLELAADRVDEGLCAAVEVAPIHEWIWSAICNHCVVDKSRPDRDNDTQDERQKGAHTYSPSVRNGRNTPEKQCGRQSGQCVNIIPGILGRIYEVRECLLICLLIA
jgi:hypothetical protein